MAEPTSEQPGASPDFERGPLDQAMIDAVLQGNGDTAGGQPVGSADSRSGTSSLSSEEISQADVDALMQASAHSGASGETDQPAGSPPARPSEVVVDSRADKLGSVSGEALAAMPGAIEADPTAPAAAEPVPPAKPSLQIGEAITLPELEMPAGLNVDPKRVTMLGDVELPVQIELGRTEMLVEDVLKLDEGSVVELDKLAGDPVDVYINDRLVARGEVLVLNDNFCVRISEVVSNDPHRVSA